MIENTGAAAPRRWLAWLLKEPVLSVLALALIILQWLHPQPIAALAGRVDWQTVATLAGLLMLTKALELSGCPMWLAHRIVHHVHSERGLAMLLVVFAAALAMWLTNDVALFVVVPLVLSLNIRCHSFQMPRSYRNWMRPTTEKLTPLYSPRTPSCRGEPST